MRADVSKAAGTQVEDKFYFAERIAGMGNK